MICNQTSEVEENVSGSRNKRLKIFTTNEIVESTPFLEVQAKVFSILEKEKLEHVADHITSQVSFNEKMFQWEHIDKQGFQFKRD